MDSTHRRVLAASGTAVSSALFGGCSALPGGGGSNSSASPPAFEPWVPAPGETNGNDRYATLAAVFWDLDRVRSFESDLHPSFSERLLRVPDADVLGVAAGDVAARVDVADQSARVYRGSFDASAVGSHLEGGGYSVDGQAGEFDVYAPGEGHQYPVAVGESAVVVGVGADIRTGDGEASTISPRRAVERAVEARRTEGARYASAGDDFAALVDSLSGFDSGQVRTTERIEETVPENSRFAGERGLAIGMRFDRPASAFTMAFVFGAADEADPGSVETAFAENPGTRQYEDVSVETDGRVVTVTGELATERFDGYLPGDPEDRN